MAIASMTGFARATGSHGAVQWVVEARSVNGRGLDLRLRLPPPFDGYEPDVRAKLQKALGRGSVQLGVSVARDSAALPGTINEAAFLQYAEQVERLTWAAKLAAPTVGDILRLPGVLDTRDIALDAADPALAKAFSASLDAAIAGLVSARLAEGAALAPIVSALLADMDARVAEAEAAESARRDAVPARLRAQIADVAGAGPGLDPARLHQEAMLIASRIDIREEIDRLKAHIAQARDLLAQPGNIGRKLDFLTQEFMREANTLCAKSNDLALTRAGLDLKALVEQFREQVQNIE